MNYLLQYKNELEKLLDNEDNVSFFCEKLKNQYTVGIDEYTHFVDFIIKFTEDNDLMVASAWLKNYKCWCYYNNNEYEKAIGLALKSYGILESFDCKKGMACICNSLMAFYSQIGKVELANDWGIKGVLMAEELEDDELILAMLLNICVGYIELEKYRKSRETLEFLENKNFEMNNDRKITYLQCLAEVEINIGDVNYALNILNKIYKIADLVNADYYIGETIKLEAMAYCRLDQYDKADELFQKAYEINKDLSNTFLVCITLFKWAEMYLKRGSTDKSLEKLNGMLSTAEKHNYITLLQKAYNLLYKVFKNRNNSSKALMYLEKYINVNEQINEVHYSKWNTRLNIGHMEREAKLYKILYDKTELLSSIGRDILSNLDESIILNMITKEISKLMIADVFSIGLYNEENSEIVYKYIGENSKVAVKGPIKMEKGISLADYCIRYGKDIVIKDFEKEHVEFNINSLEEYYDDDIKYHSLMFTPMFVKEKIIGLITVQAAEVNSYDKSDLSTLKILSNYVATALFNANMYKDMENKAIYDNLTGISNRREILKIGENSLNKFLLNGENLTIAMIDIDKFKKLNDNYGHVAGDKVLCNVADNISKSIRKTDYIGRYGGDEFLLICTNTKLEQAFSITERIRKVIYNDKLEFNNKATKVSVSIGLYEFEAGDNEFMLGVHKADVSLYEAKKIYGNKVRQNNKKFNNIVKLMKRAD
ncbi:GGDEF domain-containing protein [Sedimentibacter sp. zth1]|uniref:sensor domain-containing diguanylate cyclase n=1 Tax=Sedimentibacter sp. zth1 TaxID=2816908 RepID=UPI001A91259C|nr:GGDEF domain-containing protein [Sedimentibacter sp. zth1]QSX05949.1 GGDEF domain-containing protein [Sedimentibacter sp. zth1]